MVRLFVAVSVPEEWKDELQARCNGLPGARWIRDRQFHLTLRFLGETGNGELQALQAELEQVRAGPFELEPVGFGWFPPGGAPKVLWAGLRNNEGLQQVQRGIERAARRAGFDAEKRRFHPHLTLARLRDTSAEDVKRWITGQRAIELEPHPVTSFELCSSILRPEGARHRCERSFALF